MSRRKESSADDVEHLLRNAELRDELEPLFDESIGRVNAEVMSTPVENEFLASMLEWERAPILPISKWFTPELVLPHLDRLDEQQLHDALWDVAHRLFEKRIVLDFADHLSDHELYCLVYRDILPSHEKKMARASNYLHWDCANTGDDPETWLRFYATDEDRENWVAETDGDLPPRDDLPRRRQLPRVPL